ncbi:hypothetical protein AYI68_g6496 [Smittium mucronatum]|uniref:RGS domain-containing protein n=1 Tax=Smittium mucronatum TaxID=133383 RepID=A0A1R0GRC8_9FUNG|nr:hypothetical protein AYI68_g6496 [Smittium mucronatum]
MADGVVIETNIFDNSQFLANSIDVQGNNLVSDQQNNIQPTFTPFTVNTQQTPTSTIYTSNIESVQPTLSLTYESSYSSDVDYSSGLSQSLDSDSDGMTMGQNGSAIVMPNIIGWGIDDSPQHVSELENRFTKGSGHQFVALTIIIVYTMLVLYSLWIYHIRTAPSRRGFSHRSIKLLVFQVALNLVTSIAVLVYVGFDSISFIYIIIISYTGVVSWILSLFFRALRAIYFIKLNKAKINYFSFLKAQNNRTDIDPEILLNQSSMVCSDFVSKRDCPSSSVINNADISKITSDYKRKVQRLSSQRIYYKNSLLIGIVSVYIVISASLFSILRATNHLVIPKRGIGNSLISNGWMITFLTIYGIFSVVVFPGCLYILRKYREFRFLVSELISVSVLGVLTIICFTVWHKIIGDHKTFNLSPTLSFFISLLISHCCSVIYPIIKMKNYSVAYTSDDYASPTVRRDTRSASKNFKSSFTGKSSDYRREFLSMLDNPGMYNQLKKFSKEYISYDLILFLDEYQILKKRVLEELGNNGVFRSSYENDVNIQGPLGIPAGDRLGVSIHSNDSMSLEISNQKWQSSDTLRRKRGSIISEVSKNSFIINFDLERQISPVTKAGTDEASSSQNECRSNGRFEEEPVQNHAFSSVIVDRLLSNTPMSITICDALEYLYPNVEINPNSVVPNRLKPIFRAFCDTFINPDSNLTMNIHRSIVDDVMENYRVGEFTIGIFDDAREEVLDLLYFGVFPYYLESKNMKSVNSFRRHHFSLNKNFLKI